MQLQDLRNFIDFTCTVLVPSRNSNIFDVKSSIVFVRIFIIPSRSGFLIVLTTKIAFVSFIFASRFRFDEVLQTLFSFSDKITM